MRSMLFVAMSLAALAVAGCEKKTVVEGEAGKKLTLDKPSNVTLKQGETEKIKIEVKRTNLPGDVAIRFERLPKGVDVVENDARIVGDGKDATFTLRAAPDAELVENSAATVTAQGPQGMAATETFNVTVKEKK